MPRPRLPALLDVPLRSARGLTAVVQALLGAGADSKVDVDGGIALDLADAGSEEVCTCPRQRAQSDMYAGVA